MLEQLEFRHGELIFREGEEADFAYLLVSGHVEIYKRAKRGTILLSRLGAGELFGEMGLINSTPRTASAAADGPTIVKKVSAQAIEHLLSQSPAEVGQMLRSLMERLHENNQKISRLVDKQNQFQLVSDAPAEIKCLTLLPLSEELKNILGKGRVIDLPFRVGSASTSHEDHQHVNDLAIETAHKPELSAYHFSIQKTAEGVEVMDRGSSTGTLVNNVRIGTEHESDTAKLSPGDNLITAGSDHSPYRFCLVWEE